MTKTEQKRINTQLVIELMENKFKATNIEDTDGGRIGFTIENFRGEFHRRDYEVLMFDNIRMGDGFTQEEYDIRDASIKIEDLLNESIQNLLKQ
jgi:hypothetical protein